MSAADDHVAVDWEARLRSLGVAREHTHEVPPEMLVAAVDAALHPARRSSGGGPFSEGALAKVVAASIAAGLLAIVAVPSSVDRALSPSFVTALSELSRRWSRPLLDAATPASEKSQEEQPR